MKRLKTYLSENLEIKSYILDYHYPLSKPMLERIFNKLPKVTAFHVTDFDGLDKLVKIEGSKKSISTFTKINVRDLRSGVETKGGVVCEVEGNLLAKGDYDIYSGVDVQGRRWLNVTDLGHKFVNPKKLKIKNIIDEARNKVFIKLTGQDMIDTVLDFDDLYRNLSQKEKRLFVKYYFDSIEELSKKNVLIIKDFIYGKVRGYLETTSYNELVMNEIKIKHIYIDRLKIMDEYQEQIIKKYNKKYPMSDMKTYSSLLQIIQNTKNI